MQIHDTVQDLIGGGPGAECGLQLDPRLDGSEIIPEMKIPCGLDPRDDPEFRRWTGDEVLDMRAPREGREAPDGGVRSWSRA